MNFIEEEKIILEKKRKMYKNIKNQAVFNKNE